jgi:hypothetical protein
MIWKQIKENLKYLNVRKLSKKFKLLTVKALLHSEPLAFQEIPVRTWIVVACRRLLESRRYNLPPRARQSLL